MEPSSSKAKTSDLSGLAQAFDWFFMLRPTLMFPLWTMVLAGHSLVPGSAVPDSRSWVFLAIALTSLFGLVYLLNQMRDREGDRQNGKLALVAHNIVGRPIQIAIGIALGIIAPAGLVASGYGHLGLLMVAVFIVAGILYNYTPVALERTPWGGLVAGALGGWMLLKLGESLAGGSASFLAELPYVLAFTAGCIITGLPDVAGDKATGKRTFVVAFGERATMAFTLMMIVVSGVFGVWQEQWALSIASMAGSAIILKGYRAGNPLYAVAGNKLAMFILAIGIGISYPPYLIAIALYYPLARWYHNARFGISYPSFGLDSHI